MREPLVPVLSAKGVKMIRQSQKPGKTKTEVQLADVPIWRRNPGRAGSREQRGRGKAGAAQTDKESTQLRPKL